MDILVGTIYKNMVWAGPTLRRLVFEENDIIQNRVDPRRSSSQRRQIVDRAEIKGEVRSRAPLSGHENKGQSLCQEGKQAAISDISLASAVPV